ncbi:hypothetical protein AMAG_08315 [Allomyces macrogynus ATCC 38327]|uniref:Protein-S-isoprenylcysteine O-methyltransferase n=1 Tax=Allomyces macrogynus (strain ATCC 38327) TaxID=578462 RepID=A0A0L0SKV4_ALLM3|nr:hypothetical protein AMAG_08315 [Allomyces macrogynus ATCC 38327]|eukprot:KNE63157.1 hypothetical protein AMAG_08315 [Allomyces macrogynus ATCC 38327]
MPQPSCNRSGFLAILSQSPPTRPRSSRCNLIQLEPEADTRPATPTATMSTGREHPHNDSGLTRRTTGMTSQAGPQQHGNADHDPITIERDGTRIYPPKLDRLKLLFTVVLLAYTVRVCLPPQDAVPEGEAALKHEQVAPDVEGSLQDSYVNDMMLLVMTYSASLALALALLASLAPLHLAWVPYGVPLARLRRFLLGYRPPLCSPLYQPLTANEVTMSVVCLFGAYLRVWSFATLADHFTYAVRIFADHQLITAGPYAYLAHPSYTGLGLAVVGYLYMVGLRGWRLGLVAVGALTLTYARIVDEEVALRGKFGDQWDAYLAQRWRLVPMVW